MSLGLALLHSVPSVLLLGPLEHTNGGDMRRVTTRFKSETIRKTVYSRVPKTPQNVQTISNRVKHWQTMSDQHTKKQNKTRNKIFE